MRTPRITGQGDCLYQCSSRVVDKLFIFGLVARSSPEADRFLERMRKLEAFTGVTVLQYGLLPGHFHLVCHVPQRQPLSDAELLERVEALYGHKRRCQLAAKLHWLIQQHLAAKAQQLRERFLKRMFDLSVFIKELKGGFAQAYNRAYQRYGALWAERFKSVLLESGEAVKAAIAYIDLNAVRAGLCTDPKQYRYCGYGAASAAKQQQSQAARKGLRIALGQPQAADWTEVERAYRKYLEEEPERKAAPHSEQQPMQRHSSGAPAAGTAVVAAQTEDGPLAWAQLLRRRLRCFTDGAVLGSRAFVEAHLVRLKEKLRFQRPRTAYQVPGIKTLWILRKLRVRPSG